MIQKRQILKKLIRRKIAQDWRMMASLKCIPKEDPMQDQEVLSNIIATSILSMDTVSNAMRMDTKFLNVSIISLQELLLLGMHSAH